MTPNRLEQVYRSYLDVLNDRRFQELDRFLHEQVVYNGAVLTWQQYADGVADDARRIPDLRFTVDLLVTSTDTVACRLWFDCTPELEFAGVAPTGRPVRFAEHVFYRFRDERIEQVWSLIDTAAVREQQGG